MTKKKQILVVEDNAEVAALLRASFLAEGYRVMTTEMGEEAVRMVGQVTPDIIVLDVNLPDIDGYEVCRRLRQFKPAHDVPVIFLADKHESEIQLGDLGLGAVDSINKPYDVLDLALKVRRWLRRRHLLSSKNPATGLPEWPVVDEHLIEMLQQPTWGLVVAGIQGIDIFQEEYGSNAAENASVAISLIIMNALKDSEVDNTFVGHITAADFIIITTPLLAEELAKNCLLRLESSLPYYYPDFDHVSFGPGLLDDRLKARVSSLSSTDNKITALEELKIALSALY